MKQIGVKNVKLTEYEMSIAAHLVDPLSMHVSNFPAPQNPPLPLACIICTSVEIHRKHSCGLKLHH